PLILNQVASVADAVDDIAFGTAKGPTRFGPFSLVVCAASTMVRVDGPPEPMMMPVRTLETSLSDKPASRIACSMATWFQAAPRPRKRMARRSTDSDGSSVGAPCTWQRKPSVAYSSAREMPDLASRRLASTSWVLLPMDETMPIPVTTTRLMEASPALDANSRPQNRGWRDKSARSRRTGLHGVGIAEQPNLEVERLVDNRAVRREPAVGDAKHELRAHHPLDFETIDYVFHGRQHLAGKLEFAEAERSALARRAEPAEEKTKQLPQCVEAQAARHHRIAFEMAGEEPEVRPHLQRRAHQTLAVFAARFRQFGNAVEHQHRRQRQLRPFGKHLAPAAGQQVLEFKADAPIFHRHPDKGSDSAH